MTCGNDHVPTLPETKNDIDMIIITIETTKPKPNYQTIAFTPPPPPSSSSPSHSDTSTQLPLDYFFHIILTPSSSIITPPQLPQPSLTQFISSIIVTITNTTPLLVLYHHCDDVKVLVYSVCQATIKPLPLSLSHHYYWHHYYNHHSHNPSTPSVTPTCREE